MNEGVMNEGALNEGAMKIEARESGRARAPGAGGDG